MVSTHIETATNDQLQTLVDTREGLELARDEAITNIGKIDIELARLMQGLGAELWSSADGKTTATLKADAVWNDPELDRLREYFSPEEVEEFFGKDLERNPNVSPNQQGIDWDRIRKTPLRRRKEDLFDELDKRTRGTDKYEGTHPIYRGEKQELSNPIYKGEPQKLEYATKPNRQQTPCGYRPCRYCCSLLTYRKAGRVSGARGGAAVDGGIHAKKDRVGVRRGHFRRNRIWCICSIE